MKERALRYLLARLEEPSTMRGIVLMVVAVIGYDLSESDAVTVIAVGNLIAGAIGAALPDKIVKVADGNGSR